MSQLYNIVTFTDVAGGATVTLPHKINEDGRRYIPDLVIGNAAGFMRSDVVVTDTDLTVKNATNDVRSIDVWVQRLHTRERFFGAVSILNLVPLPIIIMPGGGGGALSDDPPINVDTDPADPGVSMEGSRADHKHDIATAAPVTAAGALNIEGASLELARADHKHRLELIVEDEGAIEGLRPAINFVGVGVTAVDNPGSDRVDVTIPGTSDGGAMVSRTQFMGDTLSQSGSAFIGAGLLLIAPVAGDYWAIFEGECKNQSASAVIEVGISVNSIIAPQADSIRASQGNANDMRPFISTQFLGTLAPGDLIRGMYRKFSGAGAVDLIRRRITIFLVQ